MAKSQIVDFSKVKDGGNFNRKRIPAGDYLAKIVKVEDAKAKDDVFQYLVSIKIVKRPSSVFPYYCKLTENQLWKLRNLLIAAGKNVPKKKVAVNLNDIVGKMIGVTVEDDEYEGKEQSTISGVFPAQELEDVDSEEIVDDSEEEEEDEAEDTLDDDEAEEEEAEEEPEEEEEEEEEAGDEYDAMDRLALRKALLKVGVDKTSKSQSDDDLRNLLREKNTPAPAKKPAAKPAAKAAPAKKTKPKASEITDDELDELDIDDL